MFRRRQPAQPAHPQWRDEWNALARYNAERARGLVHTPEWQRRMAQLQREFDEAHGWRGPAGGLVYLPDPPQQDPAGQGRD